MIGTGLMFVLAPSMPESTSGVTAVAPQQQQVRSAEASGEMPRQQIPTPTGVFTAAGNSISSASFQQAASAMQSAANAMQLAASGETAVPPATAPSQPSQTARRTPQASPAAQPQAAAPQAQTASAPPANQIQPQAQPTPQPQPTPQSTAKTDPASVAPNVRPVDLAKSASENNEFVRVSNDGEAPAMKAKTPQRAQVDSKVSKSAQAIADSVSSSSAKPPQRAPLATTILSDDEKAKTMVKAGVRVPAPTDPFIVTADGETPQNPPSSQDINDAIPEQIRKLSESIMKFGKDKK